MSFSTEAETAALALLDLFVALNLNGGMAAPWERAGVCCLFALMASAWGRRKRQRFFMLAYVEVNNWHLAETLHQACLLYVVVLRPW